MKKYLVKTKNSVYECSDLQTMLKKVTAFKVAGIEYQVQGIWGWYGSNKKLINGMRFFEEREWEIA